MDGNRNETSTRDRGFAAEQIAVDDLVTRGYRVVERNFTCKAGEIDIIAKHRGELVFVEVRSRGSARSLDPVYSVNRGKQMRLIRAAEVYLSRFGSRVPPCRFDVVLVTTSDPPQVQVVENAIEAS
jgi:putative endonuclease